MAFGIFNKKFKSKYVFLYNIITFGYKRLNGSIMENIAYSDPLSEDDQVLIENYFKYKYAPPVNLGRDRDVLYGFCETSISQPPL